MLLTILKINNSLTILKIADWTLVLDFGRFNAEIAKLMSTLQLDCIYDFEFFAYAATSMI